MNNSDRIKSKISTIVIVLFPILVIGFFSRGIFLNMVNPAVGDLTAMSPIRIPLGILFSPWIDNFVGSFGGNYAPHVILSQFIPLLSPTILQYIYFYFIFIVLYIVFLDFFRSTLKHPFFSNENLLYATLLTLIIFFSNVFTVNFVQGNPDIYYAYLFCIPAVLYLFLVSRDDGLLASLKFTLAVFTATIFAQFSLYYIALVCLPFAILFLIVNRKEFLSVIKRYLVLVFIVILANLPVIYTTIKPAFSAVHNVVAKQSSVSSVLTEMFLLYKSIDSLNLFFFSGNSGDYSWLLFNIPGGYLFRTNLFYIFLPLQIILIFVASFIFPDIQNKERKRATDLLVGITIIFLLFFLLILAWDNSLVSSITKNIPLTPLFRNPKKLILSLYVVFVLLIIFLRFNLNHKKYSLILSSVLVINFLAIYPIVSDGHDGLKKTNELALSLQGISQTKADHYFSDIYSFPVRFLKLREDLVKLDGSDPRQDYRIIVMPDNSQSLYQSYLRYIFTPFSTNGSQAIWGGLKNPESILKTLYSSILSDNANTEMLLKIANVKYLIVDRNSPYHPYTDVDTPRIRPYYGTYTTGNPELFNSILSKKKNLKLVLKNKDFYVYENTFFTDRLVYIPNKTCHTDLLENDFYNCDLYIDNKPEITSGTEVVKWQRVSTTKYKVTIDVKKSGKSTIFFSQSFDPDWELVSQDPSVLVKEHVIGSAFGNTWIVDFSKPGKYDLSISFKTQPLYAFFILLSSATLIGCLCGIVYMSKKKG